MEGVVFRKARQERGPETGDRGTFKRVVVYCYHSENLELGMDKSEQKQESLVG